MQFDAAIVPEISASKAPNSDIGERANVFIFSDHNAGNIGYKIAKRIDRAKAIEPILQGLKKPANSFSTGCIAEVVFNIIVTTILQVQVAQS